MEIMKHNVRKTNQTGHLAGYYIYSVIYRRKYGRSHLHFLFRLKYLLKNPHVWACSATNSLLFRVFVFNTNLAELEISTV